jgi:hypothetical protein
MTTAVHALALRLSDRPLAHLAPVDLIILILYFALAIFISFYVKGSMNTTEEFFRAGRNNASGPLCLPICIISSIAMWMWASLRDAGALQVYCPLLSRSEHCREPLSSALIVMHLRRGDRSFNPDPLSS